MAHRAPQEMVIKIGKINRKARIKENSASDEIKPSTVQWPEAVSRAG
jgi:hypothetical protein